MDLNTNLLEKAIHIAVEAHKGQTDKAGKPYILHLLRVMMRGKTEDEQICGVLHDLIEDTNWTAEDLRKENFPENIIETILSVTKKENETYDEFINRISLNKLAVKVKLNDLEDNMDLSRLSEVTASSAERLNKYIQAYHQLKSK